jgi:hypothetical protein
VATIRRIYIYLVCLISLQSVAAAVNGLLGGFIRWLTSTDAPDALFFTSQLAIVVVGAPIFIGHWLWALYLARKAPDELNALSRRLYLYITKGVFASYIAVAVFNGTNAFFSLILSATTNSAPSTPELVGTIINSVVTVVATGALWFYHDRLTADDKLSHDGLSRVVHQLYMLGFGGTGLTVAVVGFVSFQMWVFDRLNDDVRSSLPSAIAMMAAGAMLWLYHERARALDTKMKDVAADVLRWLYATLFSSVGVIMSLIGLFGTQTWLFQKIAGDPSPFLPDALAVLTAGIPLLIYHELALRRVMKDNVKPLRWLYGLLFSVVGMIGAVRGLIFALRWFFSVVGGPRSDISDSAALFVPCLIVWGYHQWVMKRMGDALGLAEESSSGPKDAGRLLRRVYVLAFSGYGVSLTTLGLIGLQEWVFTRFGGENVFQVSDALAWLVVGVLLWLYYWRWAGQLFASNIPVEQKSDLRKAYLYLIIYIAVNTFIITIALLINGTLRAILGLPTSGGPGLSLSIIIAAAALWVYHALVLRGDIAKAGESSLQAGMQRLYRYLVATLGLTAFIVGFGGDLSVLVRWLALGFRADIALKEQFAGFTAALIAGLPVWLVAWIPAQLAATRLGPVGIASRRSILRKMYLYFYSLVAIVVTLVSAVTVVYQLLNALFGLFGGGNVFADVAQSIGFTVIATAVWIYHGWVLRGDSRRAKQDREADALRQVQEQELSITKLAAEWADFSIAVVDDGDGSFGRMALEALRRDLAHLTLTPIGLTPEAAAAMDADLTADVPTQLLTAQLIVAPWTAVVTGGVVADSTTPKVIVPVKAPDIYWAGISLEAETGPQIVEAVKKLLQKAAQQKNWRYNDE